MAETSVWREEAPCVKTAACTPARTVGQMDLQTGQRPLGDGQACLGASGPLSHQQAVVSLGARRGRGQLARGLRPRRSLGTGPGRGPGTAKASAGGVAATSLPCPPPCPSSTFWIASSIALTSVELGPVPRPPIRPRPLRIPGRWPSCSLVGSAAPVWVVDSPGASCRLPGLAVSGRLAARRSGLTRVRAVLVDLRPGPGGPAPRQRRRGRGRAPRSAPAARPARGQLRATLACLGSRLPSAARKRAARSRVSLRCLAARRCVARRLTGGPGAVDTLVLVRDSLQHGGVSAGRGQGCVRLCAPGNGRLY